ncbi:MAG: putative sulfate exporter family transporter [Anaerolineae bacterium]|nr:putative sulfate exporter family transporter [Anaerolineae bacterium]
MTTSVTSAPESKSVFSRTPGLIVGLILVILFAFIIAELDAGISVWFESRGIDKNPFEYPLVAAILGLMVNGILRATKTHDFVAPAIKTEFFLKVGLVLMGSKVAFGEIMAKGFGGLIQGLIMVTAVFFFTWWLATKMNIGETLKAVMATAVAICGVSAAIAAAGSVLAKKEEITYITALVIFTALPLMVIMPWLGGLMGLSPTVAGAWFGGNIDTTAAVVGAGTMYGPEAQQVAAIVKMAQNVLIGVVAFVLALYFVMVVERRPEERPSAAIIWHRFPKFVLGFILLSILTSVNLFSKEQISLLSLYSKWFFALAFFCIGLELSTKEIGKMGWPPVIVYLAATVFNTCLALLAAWIIFGVFGF